MRRATIAVEASWHARLNNQITVRFHGVEIEARLTLQHHEIDKAGSASSAVRIDSDGCVSSAFGLLDEVRKDRCSCKTNQER